jgi:hypothetical protein
MPTGSTIRSGQQPSSGRGRRRPLDSRGKQLVGDGAEDKKQHEAPFPPAVEDEACQQDERLPQPWSGHEQPVSDEHQQEEDRECDGGE